MIDTMDHQPLASTRQLDHRYEGFLKVTGRAKYAAEFPVEKSRLRLRRPGHHSLRFHRLHR